MTTDDWEAFGSSSSDEDEDEDEHPLSQTCRSPNLDAWKKIGENAMNASLLYLIRLWLQKSCHKGRHALSNYWLGVPLDYEKIDDAGAGAGEGVVSSHDRTTKLLVLKHILGGLVDRTQLRGIQLSKTSMSSSGGGGEDSERRVEVDACVILSLGKEEPIIGPSKEAKMRLSVVPGGYCLLFVIECENEDVNADVNADVSGIDSGSDTLKYDKRLQSYGFESSLWNTQDAVRLYKNSLPDDNHVKSSCLSVYMVQKWACPIDTASCEWKEQRNDWVQYERKLLHSVTVAPLAYEKRNYVGTRVATRRCRVLSRRSIRAAVRALRQHGFCVLRDMLDPKSLLPWGDAACQDLSVAIDTLLEKHKVDLLNPKVPSSLGEDGREALSFKEMAMREDFRVDLRNGPAISKLRKREGKSIPKNDHAEVGNDVDATIAAATDDEMLRKNPSILQIVSGAFHPYRCGDGGDDDDDDDEDRNDEEDLYDTDTPGSCEQQPPKRHGKRRHLLYRGNYGRWNFDDTGPCSPPLAPAVGSIGFVISLPGCECQSIHADTPHLFEHADDVPPHYLHLFALATAESTDERIGATAFVAGSHRLSTCADLTAPPLPTTRVVDSGGQLVTAAELELQERKQKQRLQKRIVRPRLGLGDALLFDCRILHFGLANRFGSDDNDNNKNNNNVGQGSLVEKDDDDEDVTSGEKKEPCKVSRQGWRPMLYVNYTTAWFTDPKNWDDSVSIFEDLSDCIGD